MASVTFQFEFITYRNLAFMGGGREFYHLSVLLETLRGKRPLGRTRLSWEHLTEREKHVVEWIHLA